MNHATWHANAVLNEVAQIEKAVRSSSEFLRDAPDGSSNLREAMLVQAIEGIRVQYAGITSRSNRENPPVCTTGLSVAVAAAVFIAGAVKVTA